jgi:putative hydrolase of HD superfamily
MHNFVHEMLHDSPAARRIETLWQVWPLSVPLTPNSSWFQEYEDQSTPEARFVKGIIHIIPWTQL